jgi:cobalt-zinc-cadmium resistance protein CzcA
LGIAVPIALFLILFLLYATFQSVKQAFLIFSAIPLAAIGGIFALWLRDMPFSISAGVGFIALFGVAVLNGIVLVAEFNHLKKEKTANGLRIILSGTRVRLRPVLMTALVASLGFLPMAISSGSGAEVQKPLATVVIGGLVTATFLTLFLLPVMYHLIDKKSFKKTKKQRMNKQLATLLFLFSLGCMHQGFSQTTWTLDQCIHQAKTANLALNSAHYAIDQAKLDRKALVPIPKTAVSFLVGQYNSVNKSDNNITISQSIPFPTAFSKATDVSDKHQQVLEIEKALVVWNLEQSVRSNFEELMYVNAQLNYNRHADSLYAALENAYNEKINLGDAPFIDLQLVKVQRLKQQQLIETLTIECLRIQTALQTLLHTSELIIPAIKEYQLVAVIPSLDVNGLPQIQQWKAQQSYIQAQIALQKAQNLPDFSLGYFNQTLIGTQNVNGQDVYFNSGHRFQGVTIGTAIPVFNRATKAQIKQQEIGVKVTQNQAEVATESITNWYKGLVTNWQQSVQQLNEWDAKIKPVLFQLHERSIIAFQEGEIGVQELVFNQQEINNQQLERLKRIYNTNLLGHQLIGFTTN